MKALEAEDLPANNNFGDKLPEPTASSINILTSMKALKISKSNYDEIYEPCVESKQTRVVCKYKPIIPADENLKELHV